MCIRDSSIGIRLTRDAQAKTINKVRYVKKADLEKVEVPVAQPAVDEAKPAEKQGILRHREPSTEPQKVQESTRASSAHRASKVPDQV